MVVQPASTTSRVLGAGLAHVGHRLLQTAFALFTVKGAYRTAIGAYLYCRLSFRAIGVTSVLTSSKSDAHWTGPGLWGFNTAVTYDIEAATGNPATHTPPRVSLTLRSMSGTTLFTTGGLVALAPGSSSSADRPCVRA